MSYSLKEIRAIMAYQTTEVNPVKLAKPFKKGDDFAPDCLIIDTETTDFERFPIEVLSLTVVAFESKNPLEKTWTETWYNVPMHTKNITEKTVSLTGLTQAKLEQLALKKPINYDTLRELLGKVKYIIAHYANYDRKVLGDVAKDDKDKWKDSLNVDWHRALNLGKEINPNNNKRLEMLYAVSGIPVDGKLWVFNSHSSEDDCFALLWLLSRGDAIKQLLQEQVTIVTKGWVSRAFYQDCLRKHGFRFIPDSKTCELTVNRDKSEDIIEIISAAADTANPDHSLTIKIK